MRRKKDKKKKRRKSRVYIRLSALFPKRLIKKYEQMLIYADMEDVDPRVYVGFSFTFPMIMGIMAFFIAQFLGLEVLWSLICALVVTVALTVLFYLNLILQADSRARNIEQILPEALQLVSANVRAGMTVDRALWLTARPEFGAFEKELRRMAAQTLGGKPLQDALGDSGKRVKSRIFQRALILIVQGIQLGGKLADLLTEIAKDIRQTQALRREINAATTMYMIFIIFASVLAAPMLFAVSTFYVETTTELWAGQVGGGLGDVGQDIGLNVFELSGTEMIITPEEVRFFALASIIITTFFSALILGLIREGHAKRGVKFIPLFMLTALSVYFIGYWVIRSLFGAVIGI